MIPSAAVGGWLYAMNPTLAFTVASAVGLIGVGYFSVFEGDIWQTHPDASSERRVLQPETNR